MVKVNFHFKRMKLSPRLQLMLVSTRPGRSLVVHSVGLQAKDETKEVLVRYRRRRWGFRALILDTLGLGRNGESNTYKRVIRALTICENKPKIPERNAHGIAHYTGKFPERMETLKPIPLFPFKRNNRKFLYHLSTPF